MNIYVLQELSGMFMSHKIVRHSYVAYLLSEVLCRSNIYVVKYIMSFKFIYVVQHIMSFKKLCRLTMYVAKNIYVA